MKAILTRYIGPTETHRHGGAVETQGARIRAFDLDGNSITVPYDHEQDTEAAHANAAMALCDKMEWSGGLVAGATKDGYAFVFEGGSEYNIPVVTVPRGSGSEIAWVLDECDRLVASGHGRHVALVIAAARLIEVLGEAPDGC